MPQSPSDPEKYSLDEMVGRLKATTPKPPPEGELVTRADGTQAMRVRKRKRRTDQSPKISGLRTTRIRIAQVSGVIILLFIAGITAGVALIYANSAPFRKNLSRNIEQVTGAKLDMTMYRMNPQKANAAQIILTWPESSALGNLTATGIAAEIFPSSFLGKAMTGEEVLIDQADLALRLPGQTITATGSAAPHLKTPSIHFKRYRTSKLNVSMGSPTAPLFSLLQTEASLAPRNVRDQTQLSLHSGNLTIPGWPKLRHDRSLIVQNSGTLDFISMKLLGETEDRGTLELSGKIHPSISTEIPTLAVKLENFLLSSLIGPTLKPYFSGRVETPPIPRISHFTLPLTLKSTPTLEVDFHASKSTDFSLRSFPFLYSLSQAMDDSWYERPSFENHASGILALKNGTTTFRELHFTTNQRLSITGEFAVASDKSLTGTLQVGIPEIRLSGPDYQKLRAAFSPPRDGFCWISLTLSGTTESPIDNFRDLLTTAAQSPQPSEKSTPAASSTFEDLTRPR